MTPGLLSFSPDLLYFSRADDAMASVNKFGGFEHYPAGVVLK